MRTEAVNEDVIIIKNELKHIDEHDKEFDKRYQKDKDQMIEILLDIKDNQ